MSGSVFIETYGCAFNVSDSEALEGLLTRAGWRIARRADSADVVVLNSCTVKDRTFLDFKKRLAELRAHERAMGRPAVVVAGCVPKANPRDPELLDAVCIGPMNLEAIVEAAEAALARRPLRKIGRGAEERLQLPSIRRNPAVEILPINQGCLSACSFCQTRLARGRLASYPIRDIVERVKKAAAEGVREIWLTSQDTGAYGADLGASLPDLLEALAAVEGDFRVRLGMSSPQWVHHDLQRLLDVFESPRFYQFLHVPVQSGDDRVLRAMGRENTVAQFEEVCAAFRGRFPQIALWTDVIAGFPTETDEEFERTLELLRRTRPATVNRSRFAPRPGTLAARMPQLPSRVVSQRSRRLARLVEEISFASLSEWANWQGEAWVSEIKRAGSAVARNFAYRPIVLRGRFRPGQRVRVRVVGHTVFHLIGEIG
ncbi:MAG: tRNA (N(6)-L-threonylcarbamoyladenosine(37)-C(2))-methylthiotransferase [Candidatus Sumerlaeota bacterium]|nr:tRNA (N(6)-L-threonylcarbamoyladenosine(37)-C(2))-methylthiotransferase [Candidatus Sumerlaeota bacterium]